MKRRLKNDIYIQSLTNCINSFTVCTLEFVKTNIRRGGIRMKCERCNKEFEEDFYTGRELALYWIAAFIIMGVVLFIVI
jgi:transposase-like protein